MRSKAVGGVKREPWEHVCHCGKTFLSAAYNAKHCPECAAAAIKENHRRYDASPKGRARSKRNCEAWRAKNPQKVKAYRAAHYAENGEKERAQHREYMQANHERELARSRLYYRVKKGDQRAIMEHAKLTGKALYCERMRVTALTLPCGKRDECWNGKPCPRAVELGLKPPRGRERFDFGWLG